MLSKKNNIPLVDRFKILIRSILIVLIFMLGYKAHDLIENRTFFKRGQTEDVNQHIEVTDPVSSAIIRDTANPILPIPRGARKTSSPPRITVIDTVVVIEKYKEVLNVTDTIYKIDSVYVSLQDTIFVKVREYVNNDFPNHKITAHDTISIIDNTILHNQGLATSVFKVKKRTDIKKELFKYGVGLNVSKNVIAPNVSIMTNNNREYNLGYDFVNKTPLIGYKVWVSVKKK